MRKDKYDTPTYEQRCRVDRVKHRRKKGGMSDT